MQWAHSAIVHIPDQEDYSESSEPSSFGSDDVIDELGSHSPNQSSSIFLWSVQVAPQSATKKASTSSYDHSGPSISKIANMSELHMLLQRERYRGSNVFNRDSISQSNSSRGSIVMATASARASMVHVPKPTSTASSRAGSRMNSISALINGVPMRNALDVPSVLGRAVTSSGFPSEEDQEERRLSVARRYAQTTKCKQSSVPAKPTGITLDSPANSIHKGANESSAMHYASEVKGLIQSSKDPQVEVFAKLTGMAEEVGPRHKRKAAHERLRARAIPKMKMARQKAIANRLQHDTSQLGGDSENRVQPRLMRSGPLMGHGVGQTHHAMPDKRDSSDSLNEALPPARSRRRGNSPRASDSFLATLSGSGEIPNMGRRTTVPQPTFEQIQRMMHEIPVSRQKIKFLEVPRLRSRFHNRGDKILNGMFQRSVKTTRRKNEELALNLGLIPEDWSYASTYLISTSDLQAAAQRKQHEQQVAAVRMIEAHWVVSQMRRERVQLNVNRTRAIVRLQRWWRRRFAFIPVHRKAQKRLKEKHAAIKIQAFATGWCTRRRIRLEKEMHHLIYHLSKMQSKIDVSDVRKVIRMLACLEKLFLRRQFRILAEKQCPAATSRAPEGAQALSESCSACDIGIEQTALCRESSPDQKLMVYGASAGSKRSSQMTHVMSESRDHQYFEDDDDISTRSPSTRLSYNCNSVRLSTASPRMMKVLSMGSATPRSSCSRSILSPTPPAVGSEIQRPHSSCAASRRFHKRFFRPSLPKRPNSVEWSPLLAGRSSTPGRSGSPPLRARTPGRAITPSQ